MSKRQYSQPELEVRKMIAFEAISTTTSGGDNEVDASEAWPDF